MNTGRRNRCGRPQKGDYDSAVHYLQEFYRKGSLRSALDDLSEEEEAQFHPPTRSRVCKSQTFRRLPPIDKVDTLSASETVYSRHTEESPSISWGFFVDEERNVSSAYDLDRITKTVHLSKKRPLRS
mmetsp:Transcript_17446/g.25773  ORF Transcript_17446/g.25773 Transcript_17446/m.25773 type:complete len:127 (+) Transcript_17446:235-615(+)|eukprot:CAMPEP_0194201564 /NCGR_PEP_ID=MMETSP0156-20130528/1793_1 /TAXON_ID=33649 /ORGANISM="Thalassionema nitzschioides, Strain L26-B" /LENGTH=126 /DNA_ID=CAMNT_0038926773 /DNA_START=165 /DNA_END=545 /DNA_ORIENTATION=+